MSRLAQIEEGEQSVLQALLCISYKVSHNITYSMAKNLIYYLALFSFVLSSFFCFMRLCLLFQRTRKVRIRNTTLIYRIGGAGPALQQHVQHI